MNFRLDLHPLLSNCQIFLTFAVYNQNVETMTYLDPKADLTFKKVFGEHEELVKSLLNALLPFQTPEEEIQTLEYLPAELVPENPLRKNSIVDVRCRDGRGRQFIVEMQTVWSKEFKQRVLFNASKAYVRQLDEGKDYSFLQPVYSLNLVNEVFEPELPGYYHYYRLVHSERTDKVIDGLHLVFVELPKFKPQTYSEKKMHVLWLRYLTEINEKTEEVPAELLESPEIREAVTQLKKSAFTEAQLYSYERFWDMISVENTLINSIQRRYDEGFAQGEAAGMAAGYAQGEAVGYAQGKATGYAQGEANGEAKGRIEEKREIASAMKAGGIAIELIASMTGLKVEEIVGL